MKTFNFNEALSFMKAGATVLSPEDIPYRLLDKKIIMFPNMKVYPKLYTIVGKIPVKMILSNNWKLYEQT